MFEFTREMGHRRISSGPVAPFLTLPLFLTVLEFDWGGDVVGSVVGGRLWSILGRSGDLWAPNRSADRTSDTFKFQPTRHSTPRPRTPQETWLWLQGCPNRGFSIGPSGAQVRVLLGGLGATVAGCPLIAFACETP